MTTNLLIRRLSVLAVPALLAVSLTACGGDDASDSSTDASKADFCKVWNDDGDEDAFNGEGSADEQAKKIKAQLEESVDKLKDVGTPKDIPADARDGYEVFIDTVAGVSEDDLKKSIEEKDPDALDQGLEGDDKTKVEAFTTWATDYCAEPSSDTTTDAP